ncbi:MAG: double zinc ribbon domain-containing protein [Promethearchaeati archaeon]
MTLRPGTPIILDVGSAYTKIGFAGESGPRYVFPSITGTEKYKTVMVDIDARNIYVGNDAMKMRGVLKINHPIERGVILDWDDWYQILNHAFYTLLRIENPSDHPILYVESPFEQNDVKEFIARVLFETHQFQSLIMVPSPILSCFSVGLTTGLVIESGDGITWIVPIINGQIIYQAVQKLNLAGMDISNNLKSLLMREGINITSSAVDEIIREIKEKNCYFVLDPENPKNTKDNVAYPMPDGSKVGIPSHILYKAPEVLFQPQMLGSNSLSIPQAIIECLENTNKNYWGNFLTSMVLSGGNLMHNGFEERLKNDLDPLLSQLGSIPKPKKIEPDKEEVALQSIEGSPKINDTCPKCGNLVDLSEGYKACPICGADLSMPQISIETNKTKVEGGDTIPSQCPKCGKNIREKDSMYCPYCGNDLRKRDYDISKQEDEKKRISNNNFEVNEYFDESKNVIKFYIPDNLQLSIFNGAAILGSLPSFKKLFITHEDFQSDKEIIHRDISQIFALYS